MPDPLDCLAEYLTGFGYRTSREGGRLAVTVHAFEPDGSPGHNTQAVFVTYDPQAGQFQHGRERFNRYHRLANSGWVGDYSSSGQLTVVEVADPGSFPAILREVMELDGGVWEVDELLLPAAKRPRLTAEEVERRAAAALAEPARIECLKGVVGLRRWHKRFRAEVERHRAEGGSGWLLEDLE